MYFIMSFLSLQTQGIQWEKINKKLLNFTDTQ